MRREEDATLGSDVVKFEQGLLTRVYQDPPRHSQHLAHNLRQKCKWSVHVWLRI